MAKSKKKKLEEALITLIKQVDEEGLAFLINQARIILHNMQVDKINQELVERQRKVQAKGSKKTAGRKVKSRVKTAPAPVELEESGQHYVMIVNNQRKYLSRDELSKIVKVCYAAGNKTTAQNRLWNWLNKNRSDILLDGGISSGNKSCLGYLYNIVKSRFKPKS
jgi:ABC-type sugar transport system substrate-binding protein